MNHGPGPIIHGQDITDPTRFIVQLADGSIHRLTPHEVANQPIRQQWFTGTVNGLIASWWDYPTAEQAATQRGVLLGQIIPTPIDKLSTLNANDTIVILADQHGDPLQGRIG